MQAGVAVVFRRRALGGNHHGWRLHVVHALGRAWVVKPLPAVGPLSAVPGVCCDLDQRRDALLQLWSFPRGGRLQRT